MKVMQHILCLHLTACCPSSTTVEVDVDASQSATSLRNALQVEAVLAKEFAQTLLTIFMRTRTQAAVYKTAAAPTDVYLPSV
jgi:hypothetical protein